MSDQDRSPSAGKYNPERIRHARERGNRRTVSGTVKKYRVASGCVNRHRTTPPKSAREISAKHFRWNRPRCPRRSALIRPCDEVPRRFASSARRFDTPNMLRVLPPCPSKSATVAHWQIWPPSAPSRHVANPLFSTAAKRVFLQQRNMFECRRVKNKVGPFLGQQVFHQLVVPQHLRGRISRDFPIATVELAPQCRKCCSEWSIRINRSRDARQNSLRQCRSNASASTGNQDATPSPANAEIARVKWLRSGKRVLKSVSKGRSMSRRFQYRRIRAILAYQLFLKRVFATMIFSMLNERAGFSRSCRNCRLLSDWFSVLVANHGPAIQRRALFNSSAVCFLSLILLCFGRPRLALPSLSFA